jgi:hypothetical protein
MYMMKSKVVDHMQWLLILFKVKDDPSQFHIFCVNFHKLHALFCKKFSQLGYAITIFAQDGLHKCSPVCTKHREWLWLWLFLEWYHKDGDEFLDHNVRVTGDETWDSFGNVETTEQSKQWMHTHSRNKPRKFKQMLSAFQKADGNCFLGQDRKGMLMVEFMQQGTTITSCVLQNTY